LSNLEAKLNSLAPIISCVRNAQFSVTALSQTCARLSETCATEVPHTFLPHEGPWCHCTNYSAFSCTFHFAWWKSFGFTL